MSDAEWGVRDSRGEWRPEPLPQRSPIFEWPWKPLKILKYLFAPMGFLLAVQPHSRAHRDRIVVFLHAGPRPHRAYRGGLDRRDPRPQHCPRGAHCGGMRLRLYTMKGQGMKFKYSDKWPKRRRTALFLRESSPRQRSLEPDQRLCHLDRLGIRHTFRNLFSNRLIPYVGFRAHPVYCTLLMVGVVLLRQIHFYFVHRLIHWKPLYRILSLPPSQEHQHRPLVGPLDAPDRTLAVLLRRTPPLGHPLESDSRHFPSDACRRHARPWARRVAGNSS